MKLKDLLRETESFIANSDPERGKPVHVVIEVNPTKKQIDKLSKHYFNPNMSQEGGWLKGNHDESQTEGDFVRFTAIPKKNRDGTWNTKDEGYVYFFTPYAIHQELADHQGWDVKKDPLIHGIAKKVGDDWVTVEAHNLRYKINDKVFRSINWKWLDQYSLTTPLLKKEGF